MNNAEMTDRIATGEGFIAALDQSGGSTPKALTGYGIEDGSWAGEEEMFALIHDMRSRIIESPCFGNGKVIGAMSGSRVDDTGAVLGGDVITQQDGQRAVRVERMTQTLTLKIGTD